MKIQESGINKQLNRLDGSTLTQMRDGIQKRRLELIMAGDKSHTVSQEISNLTFFDWTVGLAANRKLIQERTAQQTLAELAPSYRSSIIEAMSMHDSALAATKGVEV